jgi:hypothetical protein
MNRVPRHLITALLTVAIMPMLASAQQAAVARVTLTPSLGGATLVPGFVPGGFAGPATQALLSMPSLTPALAISPAPALAFSPAAAANVVPLALSPVVGAQAIASRTQEPTPSPAFAALNLSLSAPSRGEGLFDGSAARRTEDVAAAHRAELMEIPGVTGVGALDGHGRGGKIMVSFHGESFRRAARRSKTLPARLEGRKVGSNIVRNPNLAEKAADVLALHRDQLTRVYGAVRARVGRGGRVIIVEFFSRHAADLARRKAWLPEKLGGYDVVAGVAPGR